MTDNAEREAFKKVCPCHPEVYWHETMKRWVTHEAYLLEAHSYNCQWQGFQAGRAVARAEVKAERDALSEQVSTQKDWVLVPREPERERLVSMAIRYDHALAVPGYYDNPAFAHFGGVGHAKRLEGTIISMRQLYEEAIG